MTVNGRSLVVRFAKKHNQARTPLSRFLGHVEKATWQHMPDVKETFNTVDFDPNTEHYIFDVGGNNYRLLATIDFEYQTFTVTDVMTHEQYNRR